MPLHRAMIVATAALAIGCADADTDKDETTRRYSDIARDESVTLFQTAAWLDTDARVWHVPVHGWVYEPEDSVLRKRAIASLLEEKFDLQVDAASSDIFAARVNWLLSDNERNKALIARIGATDYPLPLTAVNGQANTSIEISAQEVQASARDGQLVVTAVTDEDDQRTFTATIALVPPTGISVVSDIDDTIKISNVTDRRKLLEATFLRDFQAAPGMAARYRDWSDSGVAFHYVSSSPWQLYEPLYAFMQKNGFPASSLHLKAVRFRDETLLDLFRKGDETKPAQIKPILDAYPMRKFVLIGDSGEQDPEVYAKLMRQRPDQILRVYIRNVTGASRDDERFAAVFAGIEPARWRLFSDPSTLGLPLVEP